MAQAHHVHDLALAGGCTGNGGAGIDNANYRASDGDIVGNVVHDIGVPGRCNGVHGIYSSTPRGRIYNNIVYRASAWGIHLWHAASDVTIADNTVFANGAAAAGGGDYRLKRSSPAIDKGLPMFAPATDIEYDSRQRGAAPDLGAYEKLLRLRITRPSGLPLLSRSRAPPARGRAPAEHFLEKIFFAYLIQRGNFSAKPLNYGSFLRSKLHIAGIWLLLPTPIYVAQR